MPIVRWVQIRTRIKQLKSRGLCASATTHKIHPVRVQQLRVALFVPSTRAAMARPYRARNQSVMLPFTINRPFVGAIIVIPMPCMSMTPKAKSYVRSTVTAVTFFTNPVRKQGTATR
jgi:hypothetical protein